MRKLFWHIWVRLRHRYVYGEPFKYHETQCENCGWETPDDCEEGYLGRKNVTFPLSFDCPSSWSAMWKCPRCGNRFETEESEF